MVVINYLRHFCRHFEEYPLKPHQRATEYCHKIRIYVQFYCIYITIDDYIYQLKVLENKKKRSTASQKLFVPSPQNTLTKRHCYRPGLSISSWRQAVVSPGNSQQLKHRSLEPWQLLLMGSIFFLPVGLSCQGQTMHALKNIEKAFRKLMHHWNKHWQTWFLSACDHLIFSHTEGRLCIFRICTDFLVFLMFGLRPQSFEHLQTPNKNVLYNCESSMPTVKPVQ